MADLQSMTLAERMTTINNAEHSLSDGINDFTFQEACNKWLIETVTVNGVNYSGISINKYTPEEVFAIIRHKIDLRSETLNELVSELGSYYPISKYTATEALNKRNAVLVPYSLSFDGSSDYVDLNATFESVFQDNFTISAWIKSDDGQPSAYTSICGMRANSDEDRCQFHIIPSGKIQAHYKSNTNGTAAITASAVFANGVTAWTHVVFVVGTALVDIYVNNTKQTIDGTNDGDISGATKSDFDSNSRNFYIGARNDSGTADDFFDGKIDEVAIFNKALTQAEITSLYAADPQNAGDAVGITNLIGYWKFDEGTGEPQDTSGNDNHGTITGATWTVH
tara:strand:+ start:44 stop:1057 length:1014 start_codon:yes stop_codon:yes gene_type:complete